MIVGSVRPSLPLSSSENGQLKTQVENHEKGSINLRLPTKMVGVTCRVVQVYVHVFQLPFKIHRGAERDIDNVQRENDVLTRKVHSQEEEFKLQNETMRHELNEVSRTKRSDARGAHVQRVMINEHVEEKEKEEKESDD